MQLVAHKTVASAPSCTAPHCLQGRESERMSCEPATGVPTLLRRREVHPRRAAAGAGHMAAAGGRCRLQAGEPADPDCRSNAVAVDRAAAQAAGGSRMPRRPRGRPRRRHAPGLLERRAALHGLCAVPPGKHPQPRHSCLAAQVCGDAAAWGDGVVPVPSGLAAPTCKLARWGARAAPSPWHDCATGLRCVHSLAAALLR